MAKKRGNKDEDKNTAPSQEQTPTDDGHIVPVLDDIPEDDSAEPEDAGVEHVVEEEDV